MFLSPTAVRVSYSDKIEHAPAAVVVSERVDALFFGTLWFPYDRELPVNSSQRICVPGSVVRDWSVGETPEYACCVPGNGRSSVCPVPPPSQADILRALLFERPVEVWWQNGTDAWQRMETPFVYYDAVTLWGLLKRCIAVVVVLGVILTVLSALAGGLHKLSGRYPRFTMAMHAAVLAIVAASSVQIVVDFDAPLTRFAATHMLLEAMTSPLMVYTPEKEQRIRLERDAVKCCRLPHAKRLAVWLYGVRMLVCTPVAVLGMCDAAWVAMDAEFDLLIGLAVCVVFMAAVHAVAFVTGVHGVEIPLQLNDHTIVHTEQSGDRSDVRLGSLPVALHGTGWVSKEGQPTPCRVYGASMLMSGKKTSAIVLWDLGTIRYGRVKLERVVVSKSVYAANGNSNLEKIGKINANGVLRRDNDVSVVSRVLGFILWVHANTDDDDDQNLNVVHNLRAQSHRMQKGCCVRCAVVWWVAIAACLLAYGVLVYYVWDSSIWWILTIETVGVVVALDFGVLVATRGGAAVAPIKLRGGKTCPQHHTTGPVTVDDSGWVCDTCHRALATGERVVYCATCDWAQCQVCGV